MILDIDNEQLSERVKEFGFYEFGRFEESQEYEGRHLSRCFEEEYPEETQELEALLEMMEEEMNPHTINPARMIRKEDWSMRIAHGYIA